MSLELTPTDDLLEELIARFDHCVFVGMKDASEVGEFVQRQWNGGIVTCAGLCNWMNHKLMAQYEAIGRVGNDDGTEVE